MYIRNNTASIFIKAFPITSFIIIFQGIFFFYIWLPLFPHQLIYPKLIGINLYIKEGEIWRLITPMFIHHNFAHFFYNTLSLAIMGPLIENLVGKWKFILLFLVSGITGNIATYFFLPLSYTHIGSSGAVFGLLGCFFLFVLQNKFFISKQNQLILLLIMLISIMMTIFQSHINITSHLVGILTGLIIGWFISPRNVHKNELFR